MLMGEDAILDIESLNPCRAFVISNESISITSLSRASYHTKNVDDHRRVNDLMLSHIRRTIVRSGESSDYLHSEWARLRQIQANRRIRQILHMRDARRRGTKNTLLGSIGRMLNRAKKRRITDACPHVR